MKTIVIYGSGYSLNQLTSSQWDELKKFDSMGFNWFVLQKWINPTYMMVGDIRHDKKEDILGHTFKEAYDKYRKYAMDSRYNNSLFFITENQMKLFGDFPQKYEITKWEKEYLAGTIALSTKKAIDLGYERIIYSGVDYYDHRYFYLPYSKTRLLGTPLDNGWAKRKINDVYLPSKKQIRFFSDRIDVLCKVELYCYNPKSLLLKAKGIKLWS